MNSTQWHQCCDRDCGARFHVTLSDPNRTIGEQEITFCPFCGDDNVYKEKEKDE